MRSKTGVYNVVALVLAAFPVGAPPRIGGGAHAVAVTVQRARLLLDISQTIHPATMPAPHNQAVCFMCL